MRPPRLFYARRTSEKKIGRRRCPGSSSGSESFGGTSEGLSLGGPRVADAVHTGHEVTVRRTSEVRRRIPVGVRTRRLQGSEMRFLASTEQESSRSHRKLCARIILCLSWPEGASVNLVDLRLTTAGRELHVHTRVSRSLSKHRAQPWH